MLLWAGCRTIDIVLGGSGFGEGRLNLSEDVRDHAEM